MKEENPLVLMARACNNIGKELTSTSQQCSSTLPTIIKCTKSNSSLEMKKSLKRSAPTDHCSLPTTKKSNISLSSIPLINSTSLTYPSSPYLFDTLFHHLNKTFSSTNLDYSLLSMGSFLQPSHSHYSSYFPSSSYWINSILSESTQSSSSFICNWLDSTLPEGFCGQRFTNQLHLLEHLCASHTSTSMMRNSPSSSSSSSSSLIDSLDKFPK